MPDRLTDHDMLHFTARGWHRLRPGLGADFHAGVCEQVRSAFAANDGNNPGNGIIDSAPLIRQVIDHPDTRAALESILGPGCRATCHRHAHVTAAGSADQGLHQDGTGRKLGGWSRPWRRPHRFRKVLVIYYPHDVPLAMGPTGVVPGSHLLNRSSPRISEREMPLVSQAGDVWLADFDLWHRARANGSRDERIMVKFVVERVAEPTEPGWAADGSFEPDFAALAAEVAGDDAQAIMRLPRTWAFLFNWLRGRPAAALPTEAVDAARRDALLSVIAGEDEVAGNEACYELACGGEACVGPLVDALRSDDAVLREMAPVALSAVGAAAAPALVELLTDDDPWVRRSAMDTLGDLGREAASQPAAVAAAKKALKSSDEWMRHNAAAALAIWGDAADDVDDALRAALDDAQPWVRFNALNALVHRGLLTGADSRWFDRLRTEDAPQVSWYARELAAEVSA